MFVSQRTRRGVARKLAKRRRAGITISIETLNAIARATSGIPDPKQIETVELEVGTHKACGGAIWYQSVFSDVAPMSQLIGTQHRPRYEETTRQAWCKGCGAAIVDPDMLAQFAQQVTAHRNRKD